MLANGFSFVPVLISSDQGDKWHLVSDIDMALFLCSPEGKIPKHKRLALTLEQAMTQRELAVVPAPICYADSSHSEALARSGGRPVLVLRRAGENELLGIVAPFDLL
jgi:hypothetical protein